MSRLSASRKIIRLSSIPLILIVLLVLALPAAAEQGGPTSTTVRPAGTPHREGPTGSNSGDAVAPLAPAVSHAARSAAVTSVTAVTDPAQITPSTVYNFSGDAEWTSPTTFPGGSFTGTGEVRITGSSWATWNPNVAGIHILYASAGTYEIVFDVPQAGVGAVAEPNAFETYNITIAAFDAGSAWLGSYIRPITGNAGAAFLGLLSDRANIKRVVLSSDAAAGGFAFTNLTYGGTPVAPVVLLVKDVDPWDSTANEEILAANGIPFATVGSAGFAAVDLGKYPVVIVANDQPQAFYDVLTANEGKLASYVHNGGKLQFGAAAWGWNYGDASRVTLPGGAVISGRFDDYNVITMPAHPVVTGVPSPFYGTSASHASFSALPWYTSFVAFTGATVGAAGWAPTLVEYPYGQGCVLALGQPLEAAYSWGWDFGGILPNAILHMVNDPCPSFPPSIYGWLFIDENQNGRRDLSEDEGVPAQYIHLLQDGKKVRETTTTLPRGWYDLGEVPAGDYCVRVLEPAGYVPTSPDEECFTFDGTLKNVNFGVVKEQGVIGDTVYADANGNGVQDDGEAGIAGITLALWNATAEGPGAVVDQVTTDSNGRYSFVAAPGSYYVQVTDEHHVLTDLTLTGGTNPAGPITVVHGQTYAGADFGYDFQCPANRGLLSGQAWQDNNGNAVLDAGDAGLAGVEVCASPMSQIYAPRCMLTGADGSYRMCVRPHTYLVSSVLPEGSPLAGLTPIGRAFQVPLTIRAGGEYTGVNFGYVRPVPAE